MKSPMLARARTPRATRASRLRRSSCARWPFPARCAAWRSHTISTSTAGCRGFTAIIVAWLSKLNTFTMAFVSFFLVFLQKGASQIATQFNLNENASEIITGIILFFILGCEFFINYKVNFRGKRKAD